MNITPVCALLALAAALASPLALADGNLMPRTVLPQFTQECSSCHVAYPPGLLPAASWQRIMGGLDRHFGTDASLDAAATQKIADWLQANAGTYKRVREAPPQDRISQSTWFSRKHREVAPAVYQRASIKSAANCTACHGGAEQGDFDDDRVRVPQ